jgi:predicted RNA-binding Zn-ribbon protein involved in translation (DUF1610 family)
MSKVNRGFDGERVWPHWECPNCDASNPGAEQCNPASRVIRCDECGSVMVYSEDRDEREAMRDYYGIDD